MLEKLREKLLAFIESDRDVPLLAGFSVGIYMLLFYYSKNFSLANSLEQLLFFIGYYIAMPMLVLFIGYKLLGLLSLHKYRRNLLFVGIIVFFGFYFLQITSIGFSKKIALAVLFLVSVGLSISFKRYYKFLVLAIIMMSVFNLKPIIGAGWKYINASDEWKKQPDDIEKVVFKSKPNIYYIQPDGYTSFDNLKSNPYYTFDDSDYVAFLEDNNFKIYNDYRSNYPSTLLSNSATFSMKHHYIAKDVDFYSARGIIMGDNPVLRILKNNGYKTNFITENPYLIINRPKSGYDYENINRNELPFLKDGFGIKKDIAANLKEQIQKNKKSGNFYFVEKFTPGHIHVYKADSKGREEERKMYLRDLEKANKWLKDVVGYIQKNDTEAIVIIGADHGGFAGFTYTQEVYTKITDANLIKSIFGAQLAIKWNSDEAQEYDKDLKSGINLFRVLFSYMSREKKYLRNLQDNSSYISLSDPQGIYKYINDRDDVVFEKH